MKTRLIKFNFASSIHSEVTTEL